LSSSVSEGVVADQELQLTPQYRPGQLLETVPGLIVTLHSGEGKANQYLLRGYNLDHGADLETYVDGMLINQPTHAHGQGFGQPNLDVRRALPSRWSVSLGIYNLLNTHAAAAEFWYVDRLQNEIGTYPDGRADVHEHPLEPIMARSTISKQFGP
jgi:hypothetical protein